MRLSCAGMEATSMVFPGAAGRCPGGSVIPGITHMFPKQMQWESWGGGAGQALVSEEVPVLILPHPCPQPVFPVSLALLSTKAHLFLKLPPGSLFGFKRQQAMLNLSPSSSKGKIMLFQQARRWPFHTLLPSL